MKIQYYFLLLSIILGISGCGQKLPPGIPQLYPATLTVVQGGEPLSDAAVVMLDVDPAQTWSTGGTTDQDGKLILKTMGQYKGAPLGKYKVSVTKIEYPTNIILPMEPPYGDPAAMKEYQRLKKDYDDHTFMLVAPKFSLLNTPIVVEITKDNLDITVDVSPKVKTKIVVGPSG